MRLGWNIGVIQIIGSTTWIASQPAVEVGPYFVNDALTDKYFVNDAKTDAYETGDA